jgi:copper chaperone CopZ
MKRIILVVALFFATVANAQITKVTLQASGLTCSMCSNAINKSLKTLGFVEKVEANIKNSSFEITFTLGSKVEIDQLKDKVEDAGFFVASLTAVINFDSTALANDTHVEIGGTTFHFLNIKEQVVTGAKTVKILDKGYVTAKAFKLNSKYTTMECYKTGKASSCCSKGGVAEGTRIYHVTI